MTLFLISWALASPFSNAYCPGSGKRQPQRRHWLLYLRMDGGLVVGCGGSEVMGGIHIDEKEVV